LSDNSQRMRFLPLAIALALLGAGLLLQRGGDRLFERKGNTASYAGRIAIVAGFLCLVLAWLVNWVDVLGLFR
jgi:hypothetical protein